MDFLFPAAGSPATPATATQRALRQDEGSLSEPCHSLTRSRGPRHPSWHPGRESESRVRTNREGSASRLQEEVAASKKLFFSPRKWLMLVCKPSTD